MRLQRDWHSKRRAVAGIIAAVLMFAMLFTVGTSYFLYVNSNNLLYSQAASSRAANNQAQVNEGLLLVASANPNTDKISFTAQNIGGVSASIVSFFVINSGLVTAFCQIGTGGSCPSLPVSINQGTTSGGIATGVTYTSPDNYTIRVVTQRGSLFTTTYPPTATALASQALSSGAIGDLYLSFQSYTYYIVTSHGSNGNCPAASGTYSGYCLETSSGNTGKGFFIPSNQIGSNLGYSANLTNLNQQEYDLILDQFTLLYQTNTNGHVNLNPWYVVNVGAKSNNLLPILTSYTPYVLHYDTPVTVFFAANSCIPAGSGPNDGNCSGSSFGTNDCSTGLISNVFIISNGWEKLPGMYTVNQLTYTNGGTYGINYGQNTPFVSTLCF